MCLVFWKPFWDESNRRYYVNIVPKPGSERILEPAWKTLLRIHLWIFYVFGNFWPPSSICLDLLFVRSGCYLQPKKQQQQRQQQRQQQQQSKDQTRSAHNARQRIFQLWPMCETKVRKNFVVGALATRPRNLEWLSVFPQSKPENLNQWQGVHCHGGIVSPDVFLTCKTSGGISIWFVLFFHPQFCIFYLF